MPALYRTRIPEKVLAWRERQPRGKIMKPRTFKRISKEARKRYRKRISGPATGGKAYWITTLRRYLDVHPGDVAATKALNRLVGRRYMKNPRKQWYTGSKKPDRKKIVFSSSVKPTEKSHGAFLFYATGPFKSKEEAERSARYHSGG